MLYSRIHCHYICNIPQGGGGNSICAEMVVAMVIPVAGQVAGAGTFLGSALKIFIVLA